MITLLKIFLLFILLLFLIGFARIAVSVFRFIRMVRKLRKGENPGYQKKESKTGPKKQTGRYSADGHTIELGKGDYKVE